MANYVTKKKLYCNHPNPGGWDYEEDSDEDSDGGYEEDSKGDYEEDSDSEEYVEYEEEEDVVDRVYRECPVAKKPEWDIFFRSIMKEDLDNQNQDDYKKCSMLSFNILASFFKHDAWNSYFDALFEVKGKAHNAFLSIFEVRDNQDKRKTNDENHSAAKKQKTDEGQDNEENLGNGKNNNLDKNNDQEPKQDDVQNDNAANEAHGDDLEKEDYKEDADGENHDATGMQDNVLHDKNTVADFEFQYHITKIKCQKDKNNNDVWRCHAYYPNRKRPITREVDLQWLKAIHPEDHNSLFSPNFLDDCKTTGKLITLESDMRNRIKNYVSSYGLGPNGTINKMIVLQEKENFFTMEYNQMAERFVYAQNGFRVMWVMLTKIGMKNMW